MPCARISLACILPTISRHLCRLIAYLWTQLVLVSICIESNWRAIATAVMLKRKREELIIWYVIVIDFPSFLHLISNNETTGLPITERPRRLHAPKLAPNPTIFHCQGIINSPSLSLSFQFVGRMYWKILSVDA